MFSLGALGPLALTVPGHQALLTFSPTVTPCSTPLSPVTTMVCTFFVQQDYLPLPNELMLRPLPFAKP